MLPHFLWPDFRCEASAFIENPCHSPEALREQGYTPCSLDKHNSCLTAIRNFDMIRSYAYLAYSKSGIRREFPK